MSKYFPVYLNLDDQQVVVIGGDELGESKSLALIDCGAKVVVISKDVSEAVRNLSVSKQITWFCRGYEYGDLEGAFIAIVTDTRDPKLIAKISDEATERNIPINVVDVTNLCTWIAPAVIKRGEVSIAISTGGTSPALARRIREQISNISPVKSRHNVLALADLAPVLADVRNELRVMKVKVPADHWQVCISDELLDLVVEGKINQAKELLLASLLDVTRCGCDSGECRKWIEMLSVPNDVSSL